MNHHHLLHVRASTVTQNRNLTKYFVYDKSGVREEKKLRSGFFESVMVLIGMKIFSQLLLHFALHEFHWDTSSHPEQQWGPLS